jgi:hypothetical protein
VDNVAAALGRRLRYNDLDQLILLRCGITSATLAHASTSPVDVQNPYKRWVGTSIEQKAKDVQVDLVHESMVRSVRPGVGVHSE